MSDIAMCTDGECPSAEICYRFTAMPSKHMQSYFARSQREPNAVKCPHYMRDDPKPNPTPVLPGHP